MSSMTWRSTCIQRRPHNNRIGLSPPARPLGRPGHSPAQLSRRFSSGMGASNYQSQQKLCNPSNLRRKSPPDRGYKGNLLHYRCRSYTKAQRGGVRVGLDCLERPSRPYLSRGKAPMLIADHRRVHDRLLNVRRADPRLSGVVGNAP